MTKLPDFDKSKKMLEEILKRKLSWVESLDLLHKIHIDKPKKLVVYALEMNNGTVKIGVTKNLLQRMQSIESSTSLKILQKYHTDFAPAKIARMIELSCHKKFEDFLVHGEYFNMSFDAVCSELANYGKEIEIANEKSDEDYQKAVKRAWEVFEALEDNYFNRPAVKQLDLLAPFADFVALEHDKFNHANSEESKTIAKAQLLRELASASKDDDIRNELVLHAAKILIGEDFDIPKYIRRRVIK